ncbi:helix-turn-helix transcriptional regulator, partial [Blautia wexlerae]|uniref:helix-turn-helix domain-containing protein n=2 Tax=Bacillota TaxID=1239 RepID=UPI00156F045F
MLKLDVKKYVDEQFDNLNQFAKATGLNYQAAQKIYNGETTRITFDNLESICKTLNVTPNDIFIFDDSNKESKQNPTQIQTFH